MAVTITQKTPSNNSAVIGWNSNPAANVDANVYVSPNQADLANPPNFPATVISTPADQTGLLPGVTSFTATVNGLLPGTTYYVLCEADSSYSAYPDSFTTTGSSVPPVPITVQDAAVTVSSVAPLTLQFVWDGPNCPQGQVYLGTSPTNLALAGTDTNAGARHSYSISQGLSFSQTYYYQVVSADASGNPVSQGPVMAVVTPAAPNNNTYLVTPVPIPNYPRPIPFPPFPPPHPPVIPFVTNPNIHPGGRSVITVETRNGLLPAVNALVEFTLSDPTMGKLGHGNLIGGDKVQLYSDPHMFETVVFVSSGKVGSVRVGVRVVGSSHANATASAVIQVS